MRLARKRANASRCSKTLPAFCPCGGRFTPLPAISSFLLSLSEYFKAQSIKRISNNFMRQMFHSTAYDSFLFDSSVQVVKSHDQTQPGRNGMPEEQSVHAGMARPIRMDAGILCDQAYLS
ncbi:MULTISPECIES: hypothetical protein [unclassified Pantoea]|uniref:hypothetical protein n=1 Tax=unclassified Pantoea TaxID=2630326 RepID=UPI0025568DAD|nr:MULTISPECIES: hypothetical protein [unclassified Pantoea]